MVITFKGGYRFKKFLGEPKDILNTPPLPSRILIPLKQGFGVEVKPRVKVGDKVFAGQIIGRDDEVVSSPVHSSVNGVVEEIKRMNYFHHQVTMVVIRTTDFSPEVKPLSDYSADWEKLDNEKIEELIYLSGVSALDKEGIPTRFRSSIISPEQVRHLIIHGIGSEAYNLSLELLLEGKNLFHFFSGIKILKRILPKAFIHLAINSHKKRLLEQLHKLSFGLNDFALYPLEPKYPQGYDEMLVPTILKENFPYGYSAANINVVILNIQAVLLVYKAVAEGIPLIERTVALCGPQFKENIHLKVRIGTPLEEILRPNLKEPDKTRVILNSLLTGPRLNHWHLPVDKTFSQIIALPEEGERKFFAFLKPGLDIDSYSRTFLSSVFAFSKRPNTNIHGEPRPCIFCNWCAEVCPVRIIPHLIYHYLEKNIVDETLIKYGVFNCIECNLCSYVCPSKIPLAKSLKDTQERLITIGCDRSLCILPYFDLKGLEEYRGIK